MTILAIGDGERLTSAIDAAFPGAQLEIDFDAGWFHLLLRMPGMRRALDARELSDGTLKYLCLLAALLSPRPPSFLALNEPESSLHPDLLAPLGTLIADAGMEGQIVVTTHAEKLVESIARSKDSRVIRLVKQGGATLLERDAAPE